MSPERNRAHVSGDPSNAAKTLGNYIPTEETVRHKMERRTVLFAKDEVACLLAEIDALRSLVAGQRGPTYAA